MIFGPKHLRVVFNGALLNTRIKCTKTLLTLELYFIHENEFFYKIQENIISKQ